MEKKQNRIQKIIILLLLLNCILVSAGSGYLLATVLSPEEGEKAHSAYDMEKDRGYILYIGLNDKDTYEQIIPEEEAKERVNAICAQYVGGYTLVEAQGGWVDEKNVLTQENTLIYYLRGADGDSVKKIMDQVISELNQNSILLEEQTVSCAYYYGGMEGGGTIDEN